MKFLRNLVAATVIFGMASVTTGCFGSFQLTRNFYEWHDSTFDNKFVKSLLFWIPFSFVYTITAMIDTVILNLIEFWSGSNPISMEEGDFESEHHTYAGVDYKVEATKNQFKIITLSGADAGKIDVMRFDTETKTWFYEQGNKSIAVMSFEEDENMEYVSLYTPSGDKVKFDANNTDKADIAKRYNDAVDFSTVANK